MKKIKLTQPQTYASDEKTQFLENFKISDFVEYDYFF